MQAALLLKPSPFADVVQLVEALAQRRHLRRDRFRRVGGERALHEAGEFRHAVLADAPAHQLRRADPEAVHVSRDRSEEHTSELQSLMRISYAVFCLKKKNTKLPTPSSHRTQ